MVSSHVGYLVYFAERACTPSGVSFSPHFSNAGHQKKAIFLKLVVRSVISLLFYGFLTFWIILLADLF